MLDIVISVMLALDALATGYLGVHMALHPLGLQDKAKVRKYKVAFIGLAVFAVCLVVWQGVRTKRSQDEMMAQIKKLGPVEITRLQVGEWLSTIKGSLKEVNAEGFEFVFGLDTEKENRKVTVSRETGANVVDVRYVAAASPDIRKDLDALPVLEQARFLIDANLEYYKLNVAGKVTKDGKTTVTDPLQVEGMTKANLIDRIDKVRGAGFFIQSYLWRVKLLRAEAEMKAAELARRRK